MPKQKSNYLLAFAMVTSLFFIWAFLHNINPILIPHLKKACQLSDTQSALIDTAVYLGYFTIALPAGWFMHKFGYKPGILTGLFLYAAGALIFVPAAGERSYLLFLTALFIQAAGATFLETVANPYVTKLGDKSKSEQRLNLAQSFNGVGAFVAPLVGGAFILSGTHHSNAELSQMSTAQLNSYLQSEASTVEVPYIVIASIVLIVALMFVFTRLPAVSEEETDEEKKSFSMKVFRHPHVCWSVVAQFFYVGAQVCVGSFFIRYAFFVDDMAEKNAAAWWGGIAMVGFMAGRFVGTYLMRFIAPARLLTLYSAIAIALLTIALINSGRLAVYAVMAVPFFMSIMFPTIFALGIKGLGEESKIASSFLVMSIVGGAFLPLLMGLVSDKTGSIQQAYIVPLLCFVPVLYFGWRGYRPAHTEKTPVAATTTFS